MSQELGAAPGTEEALRVLAVIVPSTPGHNLSRTKGCDSPHQAGPDSV